MRTVTVTVGRVVAPLLQDLSNRAWGDGNMDLYLAVRMVLHCLQRPGDHALVEMTAPLADKLRLALPETDPLARQIATLLTEEEEANAVRGSERRDRPSVRHARRFLA